MVNTPGGALARTMLCTRGAHRAASTWTGGQRSVARGVSPHDLAGQLGWAVSGRKGEEKAKPGALVPAGLSALVFAFG